MATYQQGILGPFRGKVGQVVGSSWNGIFVMRSLPVYKKTEGSALQLAQRERFKRMTRFLRPLTELLNASFSNAAKKMTGFNKAFSENMPAVSGLYPDIKIDYSKICLSKGKLPLGEPPYITSPEAGKLLLTWKTGDGINQSLTNGKAFIAAYSEELDRWIYATQDISQGETSFMLEVMPFTSRSVHVYIGFLSKEGKKTSESRYMGLVNILSFSV